MLLLEGYISNFTCASYSLVYVEFSDFYVTQSSRWTNYICMEKQNNPELSNQEEIWEEN
jgi:hypothetical protein